jgi:uncharacterized membrane protein YdbT with pleckstrin-like domain
VETEQILFEGHPAHKAFMGQYILGLCLIPIGGIGLAILLFTYVHVRTTRWHISSIRIEWEHGLIIKTVDTLETWRIKDIQYSQTIIQRLLGDATIVAISTDSSTPKLNINGMPNTRQIFERLRTSAMDARKARGVVAIES